MSGQRNRSSRGGRRRHNKWQVEPEPLDIGRIRGATRRVEARHGAEWTVQQIRSERAQKPYRCPGCGREVGVGVAHVAVWRADSVLGDESALADRRHCTRRAGSAGSDCGVAAGLALVLYRDDDLFDDDHDAGRDRNGDEGTE